MNDVEQYAEYFPLGLKITVCIPMDNNELFRDWAIVEELEEDIITLQMSRDELPAGLRLIAGILLDLRVGKAGMGFRCNGYFIGYGGPGIIYVHLTGDIASSELREFYRIYAFLPFRYQFSTDQNLDILLTEWRKRRQIRLENEIARKEAFVEKRKELLLRNATRALATKGRDNASIKQQVLEEFNPVDETWDYVNATAMNLSAGGFRFVTSESFKLDELVFIEMFLPAAPPRIMDSVARVVSRSINYVIKDGQEHYNIAVQFVLIDDRDRDAIVSHISHLESSRIRQLRQLPSLDLQNVDKRITTLQLAVWTAVTLIFIFFISTFYYMFSQQKFTNEIQDAFQNAVRIYRERTGQ